MSITNRKRGRPVEKPMPESIPEPREIELPPRGYQPRKAELEAEVDMPGMTDEQVRKTFFRPFKFQRSKIKGA